MNYYKIQVVLNVIAKDDESAEEKVREDITENLTEIDSIKILAHEIYN